MHNTDMDLSGEYHGHICLNFTVIQVNLFTLRVSSGDIKGDSYF